MTAPARRPWFLRGRLRHLALVALVLDLGTGVFSTAMAVADSTSAPAATAATTTSAVTVAWTDDRSRFDPDYGDVGSPDPADPNQALYQGLTVTVSQTADLTDQGLQVTWTGGHPSSASGAAADYLQIMQCWAAKGQSGPKPQQCQWGTPNAALASGVGTDAASRALMTGSEKDPKQDYGPAYTHAQYGRPATNTVPFWSVGDPTGKHPTWTNDQYDLPPFGSAQSNEVTYARTAADGTGQEIVNLQSALSAPYLGCGNPEYAAKGDTCWLVIVPRGEYNLNGEKAADQQNNQQLPQNPTFVAGSPLSATAWQDRMQVQLSFSAIGADCTHGQDVRTAGSELVSSALLSWQAPLCRNGTIFGFSEIGDPEARTTLVSSSPGSPAMDFVGAPADPRTTSGQTIDYAPVTTSALVVSYLIDKNYTSDKDNPDLGANGTLVTDLRLSPLLVAKLLTQSYRDDTPGDGKGTYPAGSRPVPSTNPDSLTDDPEFRELNPDFAYFYGSSAPDGLIVPFGDSDAAKAIWDWLRSDSATRRFLAGEKDPWGMTINPAYLGLDLAKDTGLDSFPKADPSTYRSGDAPAPGYGTIDMRPYANDFTNGALRTVMASNGQKTFWDITKVPPQYAGGAAQQPGQRFELAITTSQAAALYGLPVASLVTDDAETDAGVAPTAAAMNKELAGASVPTGVPGVDTVDPSIPVPGGYPLTMRTYAAINVCAADSASLSDYAGFLDYAAGAGQVSGARLGQLPLGYAPLQKADTAQTRATAAALRAEVAHPACASHQTAPSAPPSTSAPTDSPTSAPSSSTTSTAASNPGQSVPAGSSTAAAPGAAPSGGVPPTSAASPSSPVAAVAGDAPPGGITPAAYVTPALRYALLAALCFALPCLVAGPRLLVMTRRRG